MARFIASLLLVGLMATVGCKKDTSKDKPADSANLPTGNITLPLGKTGDTPAECKKLCTVVGKCALKDGKCYADSAENCRKAFGCRSGGLCSLKDGLCQAMTNSDCEPSDICKAEGRCLAVNGRCENVNIPADK